MKKIGKVLGLTVPLLAALGIELVISVYALLTYYAVYFIGGLFRYYAYNDTSMNPDYLMANLPYPTPVLEYVQYTMQIMWIVIFYFWYQKVKNREVEPTIKLFRAKSIILIVVLGIGFNLSTSGLMTLVLPYFQKLMDQYMELMNQLFTGIPFMVFVSCVIFAPIGEELIFRGVILQKALRFAPFFVANILQALLFGIFHMNLVQGVYTFVFGLAMGYVAYRFKTIWASILLHAVYNGLGYVIVTPGEEWWLYVYMSVGVLLTVISIGLLRRAEIKPVKNQSITGTAIE